MVVLPKPNDRLHFGREAIVGEFPVLHQSLSLFIVFTLRQQVSDFGQFDFGPEFRKHVRAHFFVQQNGLPDVVVLLDRQLDLLILLLVDFLLPLEIDQIRDKDLVFLFVKVCYLEILLDWSSFQLLVHLFHLLLKLIGGLGYPVLFVHHFLLPLNGLIELGYHEFLLLGLFLIEFFEGVLDGVGVDRLELVDVVLVEVALVVIVVVDVVVVD